MGTATEQVILNRYRLIVGAYSITDGDCDCFNLGENPCKESRSVFHYRWGLRRMVAANPKVRAMVGAYSITDGDCDGW